MISFLSIVTAAACILANSLQVTALNSSVAFIPATVANAPSKVSFVSDSWALDGPKVSPINGTTYDWWYFDAVSPDQKSSIVLIFLTTTAEAFFVPHVGDDVDFVFVLAKFPNGTVFTTTLDATQVVITTVGGGSNGVYHGANASWTGTPDHSVYVVAINAPKNGLIGTFTLNAVAPPHYPCGPERAGESMVLLPGVGWSNAVPDGDATVDMKIQGSDLKFLGYGYHDKNWGNMPFVNAVQSWYWGHGRLGPYSLVWFSAISSANITYTSGYVATSKTTLNGGKIISANCDVGALTVRPTGANSTYPPHVTSGEPQGYNLKFDISSYETLIVDVSRTFTLFGSGQYSRWIGSLSGGIKGSGKVWKGTGLWEQFSFLP